jgi:type VII secretion-associated serine protease mycosin
VLAGLVAAGTAAPAPAAAAEPIGRAVGAQTTYRPHEQLAPLRAEQAWQYSTGDGVVVAVLDSGVDAGHPDLAGRVAPGHDYVDGSTDGRVDPVGHGTTVASQIAGGGDPAIGLAPDATILPVRVLDERNRYRTAATVADGVVWAVDHGAGVINLSLGGIRDSPALGEALAYAMDHDVVVIACTGNRTSEEYQEVWYPAREPGVVAVSGVTYAGGNPTHWESSLTGPQTVLSAPAVMTGAQAGGGYREVQGTSFSSALVAGVAALIRARWPDLSAGDVVNRLVATAQDAGAPGRDPVYGFGAVDPVAALTAQLAGVPGNPLDTTAHQGASGFGTAPEYAPEQTAEPSEAPASEHREEYTVPPDTGEEVAGGQASTDQRGGPPGPAWVMLAVLTVLPAAVAAIRFRVIAVIRFRRRV